MATFIVAPAENDVMRFMHRWDLYQWADKHGIEYPKDAPAELMKTLVQANGAIPTVDDFNPVRDERGNIVDWKYKRLSATEAPRSRHADADDAETARVLAKRRAELEGMNERQLIRRVKDQFGPKIVDRDLSREDMIALFVGEAEEAEKPTEAPEAEESNEPRVEAIPGWLLNSLAPPSLVKICRNLGIEATVKDGKPALLEKIRSHGHAA